MDQMFETTAEAESKGLEPTKLVEAPSNLFNLLLTVPRWTSVVVPQCYMVVYPCVYGLEQYGHLNNSWPLCFLFCNLKYKIGNN